MGEVVRARSELTPQLPSSPPLPPGPAAGTVDGPRADRISDHAPRWVWSLCAASISPKEGMRGRRELTEGSCRVCHVRSPRSRVVEHRVPSQLARHLGRITDSLPRTEHSSETESCSSEARLTGKKQEEGRGQLELTLSVHIEPTLQTTSPPRRAVTPADAQMLVASYLLRMRYLFRSVRRP